MEPAIAQYWKQVQAENGLSNAELYDVFKIGNSPDSANNGLRLILSGEKTATSSLPEEFTDKAPPKAGDLSIVLDGSDNPGCLVETTEAKRLAFNQVNEKFANDYGEWDKTLTTWRKENGEYYQSRCKQLGIEWHENRELICEYFRVLHVAQAQQN